MFSGCISPSVVLREQTWNFTQARTTNQATCRAQGLILVSQVVKGGAPCHLYFDTEFATECNPGVNGEALLDKLLQACRRVIRYAFFWPADCLTPGLGFALTSLNAAGLSEHHQQQSAQFDSSPFRAVMSFSWICSLSGSMSWTHHTQASSAGTFCCAFLGRPLSTTGL